MSHLPEKGRRLLLKVVIINPPFLRCTDRVLCTELDFQRIRAIQLFQSLIGFSNIVIVFLMLTCSVLESLKCSVNLFLDHVKGETSTKHQVDEYEAVSDENEHSVSPEGPSRKESKKKKRRDRSNSPGRQSYYDEKRRSDLMAEGGRRVFIDYDHRRESKKSRKSKHDDKDENDSKYEDDGRSHYSSRKRSTSPTGKKSKRSRRDEEENLGSQEELDESEKQKTRRERAKDFIARQKFVTWHQYFFRFHGELIDVSLSISKLS